MVSLTNHIHWSVLFSASVKWHHMTNGTKINFREKFVFWKTLLHERRYIFRSACLSCIHIGNGMLTNFAFWETLLNKIHFKTGFSFLYHVRFDMLTKIVHVSVLYFCFWDMAIDGLAFPSSYTSAMASLTNFPHVNVLILHLRTITRWISFLVL